MCGIVGAVAKRRVSKILLVGLKRLEYRGYDSAGLAILETEGITRVRALGKVANLEAVLTEKHLQGHCGIAHTRWATHGAPSENNAHPHLSHDTVAVVHNGIINNYDLLKAELEALNYAFITQTDTEAVAHLIHYCYQETRHLRTAVQRAITKLTGAYALAVIHRHEPGLIVCAHQGTPIVIGLGIEEHFVASDQIALLPVTDRFLHLAPGEIAEITADQAQLFDQQGQSITRASQQFDYNPEAAEKGKFKHYMLKEIYEQPQVAHHILAAYCDRDHLLKHSFGKLAEAIFSRVQGVQIVACGTSYHAGLVAKYWLEAYAQLPTQVEVASEYRYRATACHANQLFITLSQSGETADTLAALRKAQKQHFLATLAICNVPGASLVRESDLHFITQAGPEIGVASTKAFSAQLMGLLLLTLSLIQARLSATLSASEQTPETTLISKIISALKNLPEQLDQLLLMEKSIRNLAKALAQKKHALFLGRGALYPIAIEGALKLKEISYIHAEAYPGGELKHGPLALVDKEMPVIVLAAYNALSDKIKADIEVVSARSGELYIFADQRVSLPQKANIHKILLPDIPELLEPIVMTLPLQLLAYHVAVLKGTDVDQPRNLAKSVTVE